MNEKKKRLVLGLGIAFILLIGFTMGWHLQDHVGQKTGEETISKETAAEAEKSEKEIPIYFVEMEDKKLAISFDAAWGCERTEKILDVLRKYNVQATFFLTNIWLDDYPDMAKKIADAGHEIAMHSVTHPHMSQISREEVKRELDGNYQRIVEVTGYTPQLFRFPFGEYDNKSIDVVREKGYYPIQWSIDSLDWMESKTAEDIIDRVELGLHPGAIILCHNNGTYTADAIEKIIPYAQQQGYQFVPIGQLIYKGDYETDHQGMERMPVEKDAPADKNTAQ